MSTANDPDRRDVRLEDPAERWEQREGYLTRLVIGWGGTATTSTQLRAEELQDIVNAAADQYGITAQPPDPWCRDESCQFRNWRSGDMPTHRKGDGCPS